MPLPDCPRPNTARSNPHDPAELLEPFRSQLTTMVEDLGGLAYVSLYRDPGRQWDLRHDRCPGHECNTRACKGHPTTASPYGSNHPKRKAADLGGRNLTLANRLKREYGLKTPVPGEPWHFEQDESIRPTRPIRKFIETTGHETPPPALPEEFHVNKSDEDTIRRIVTEVVDAQLKPVEALVQSTVADDGKGNIGPRVIDSLTRIETEQGKAKSALTGVKNAILKALAPGGTGK